MDIALEFAKKNGFETVIDRGQYEGGVLYELILYAHPEKKYVCGYPQFIIVKNGDVIKLNQQDSMKAHRKMVMKKSDNEEDKMSFEQIVERLKASRVRSSSKD